MFNGVFPSLFWGAKIVKKCVKTEKKDLVFIENGQKTVVLSSIAKKIVKTISLICLLV